MKAFNKTSIALALTTTAFISGCSTSQPKPISTEVVPITQPKDNLLDCQSLADQMNQIEKSVSQMVEIKQQRQNKTFTFATIMDITLNILSMGRAGASGHIDRATLEGFNQKEQLRILSLAQRHDYLLALSRKKSCQFTPKIEELLNRETEKSQSFRKRVQ